MFKLILKTFFYIIVSILLIVIGSYVWGSSYGKTLIKENNINFKINNLNDNLANFKIASFSDVDLDNDQNTYKKLNDAINVVNQSGSDLFVLNGGLINPDKLESYKIDEEKLANTLLKIKTKNAKFVTLSEQEKNSSKINTLKSIYFKAGFIVLNNNKRKIIVNKLDQHINLINYTKPNWKLLKLNKNEVNIAFDNHPKNYLHLKGAPINFFIHGFSHNGIVQPQILHDFYKKELKSLDSPLSEEVYGNTKIITQSGIGTIKLPFRIWNNPKVEIFSLEKK